MLATTMRPRRAGLPARDSRTPPCGERPASRHHADSNRTDLVRVFRHVACLIGLLGGVIVGGSGCAQLGRSLASGNNISKQQDERAGHVAHQFAQHKRNVRFESARQSLREGDTRRCMAQLQELLGEESQHLEARLLLGELLLDEGRADQAMRVLEPALASDPEDAQLHYLLGVASDALGEPHYALAHYELAYRQEPNNPLYAASYQMAAKANGPRAATSDFPKGSCGVSPCDAVPGGAVVPTSWAAEANRSPAQGTARLQGNHAATGNAEARMWLDRGSHAVACGDGEAAAGCFARAMAADSGNPYVAIAAAVSALQYNQSLLAVSLLESASSNFSTSPGVYRALGLAYYRLGEFAQAQRALEHALWLDNTDGLSYFLMGCTLAQLGHDKAAATFFRQAGTLDATLAAGG